MLGSQHFHNKFWCKCKRLVVGRKRCHRWAQIRTSNKLSPKFCYEIYCENILEVALLWKYFELLYIWKFWKNLEGPWAPLVSMWLCHWYGGNEIGVLLILSKMLSARLLNCKLPSLVLFMSSLLYWVLLIVTLFTSS